MLQEVGSFVVGPISKIFYTKFPLFLEKNPLITLFFDYIAIIEGLIFPAFIVDNGDLLIKSGKSAGYGYFFRSHQPKKYIGGGLLILSKFPLEQKEEVESKGDSIHRPSSLLAEIKISGKKIWIANSYFVPSLSWLKPSYVICNIANLILSRNPAKLRKSHLLKLHRLMSHNLMISTGDFNMKKGIDDKKIEEILEMKDSDYENKYTFKTMLISEKIDYIFHSQKIKIRDFNCEKFSTESDHRPIEATIEI